MDNKFYIYNVSETKLVKGILKYLKILEGNSFKCSQADKDEMSGLMKGLISFGCSHGFYGNLWQGLTTYFLLMDENPYTLSMERNVDKVESPAYDIALNDIRILFKYYNADLSVFSKVLDTDLSMISDFKKSAKGGVFNDVIRDFIMSIAMDLKHAKDAEEFLGILEETYVKYGVGDLGFHKAFRITNEGVPTPINKIANVHFDDLIGLETQKETLIGNTKAFIEGKNANNCLLYGDTGTGKSSSIKALANQFYESGLRIIEIYKHELKSLNSVISYIKDRNYKFIIYMDDLSFEEFETEYKYLKGLIEGGLEKKPENLLIYATSNRRHLVRESFKDRNDDINRQDTMQEKLSLFARFGVTIFYGAPDKKTYNRIVLDLKKKYNLDIEDEELLRKANAWEVSHGHRSGRGAQQLLDYIESMM